MISFETLNRRLYVSMLVSLDGFIEGPERELDWFEDGDAEFERYYDEMLDSVGLALYGRRSYELMLQYWPNAERNPRSAADLAGKLERLFSPQVLAEVCAELGQP